MLSRQGPGGSCSKLTCIGHCDGMQPGPVERRGPRAHPPSQGRSQLGDTGAEQGLRRGAGSRPEPLPGRKETGEARRDLRYTSFPTQGEAPSQPSQQAQGPHLPSVLEGAGGGGTGARPSPPSLPSAPQAPPPPKRAPTTALTLRSKSMTSELEELGECHARAAPASARPSACSRTPLPAPTPERGQETSPCAALPRWPAGALPASGVVSSFA